MNSCYQCKKRHENCHSVCEDYAEEVQKRKKELKNRTEAHIWREVGFEHTKRIKGVLSRRKKGEQQ